MAGLPPLSGFLGKVLLLDAGPVPPMGWIWAVVLGSGLLTLIALARAGSLVFWRER